MDQNVLKRTFNLSTHLYRDGSGEFFKNQQYFYVIREPQSSSPTVGYLYYKDAIEEAKRLHTTCPSHSRNACRFVVMYRDELMDQRFIVSKTEWTTKGAEVVPFVTQIPTPYDEGLREWQTQHQPEVRSNMQFTLQNPQGSLTGLQEVPELFWMIYSPPVSSGAVNNAAILPTVGYTDYEEVEKEAGVLHTKLFGQRPVYIMETKKLAKPVAPQVKFETPKPTTAGALTS